MGLSSDLVSQFTKITNDSNKKPDVQLRGTITKYDEKLFVQLDGSNELTPIARTVEVAEGDRVEVTIANHSATVTGNLSDPAIGIMRAGALESKIEQTASEIRLEVSDTARDLESRITLNADNITTLVTNQNEFSEFKQTVEGFEFMGTGGTVKISGGNLDLTGVITFSDFDSEVTDKIDSIESTAEGASSTASTALSRANSAYSYASSIALPTYLESTKITSTTIESPNIEGNNISVYGTFQTKGTVDGEVESTGYMGAAKGKDSDGSDTYGVALANTWNSDTFAVSNSYVIVTNAGVRLQFGDNSLVVSQGGVYINTPGSYVYEDGNTYKCKAYYDNGDGPVEIGSGTGGTVTAVWG